MATRSVNYTARGGYFGGRVSQEQPVLQGGLPAAGDYSSAALSGEPLADDSLPQAAPAAAADLEVV